LCKKLFVSCKNGTICCKEVIGVPTIGERLKNEREKRGWSQVYVAQRLGMKRSSTYANWEYNLRQPDAEMIAKLAELYEVTTDYLLTGETNKPQLKNDMAHPNLQAFAYRLMIGMQQKGISIEQAAEECDVTPEYIQQLMTAPKKLPGASTLLNLAMLIDVTPDYLGGFTDDPKGYSPHTPKPKDLKAVLEQEEVMFDGAPLSEEDKEMILGVINALNIKAKKMNKKKKKETN
jgi:transcriptional regulator with XRE-family HTH domain